MKQADLYENHVNNRFTSQLTQKLQRFIKKILI